MATYLNCVALRPLRFDWTLNICTPDFLLFCEVICIPSSSVWLEILTERRLEEESGEE